MFFKLEKKVCNVIVYNYIERFCKFIEISKLIVFYFRDIIGNFGELKF